MVWRVRWFQPFQQTWISQRSDFKRLYNMPMTLIVPVSRRALNKIVHKALRVQDIHGPPVVLPYFWSIIAQWCCKNVHTTQRKLSPVSRLGNSRLVCLHNDMISYNFASICFFLLLLCLYLLLSSSPAPTSGPGEIFLFPVFGTKSWLNSKMIIIARDDDQERE